MKKKLITIFIVCVATVILLCSAAFAAEVTIDVTDGTLWAPIESTLTEIQKTNGWPKVDGTSSIGWGAGGNILQILDKVNFGDGLTDVKMTFSSSIEPGVYLSKYPDAKLIIRIDSATGSIIAEINPDSAGKDMWTESVNPAKIVITEAGKACKGMHSTFLEIKIAATEPGYNIWPITFVVAGGQTATAAATSASNPTSTPKTSANVTKVDPTSLITKTNSPNTNGNSNQKLIILIMIGSGVIVAGVVTAFIMLLKKGKI